MTRRSRTRRWILMAVLFVLAVNLIGLLVGSLAPTPGGPTSSSYATGPDGLAAWAELLVRSGHEVTRSRVQPEDVATGNATTLVIVDPTGLSTVQRTAVLDHVERGGRLIAGGSHASWTEDILPGLAWSPRPLRKASVLVPTAETAGVSLVTGGGSGSFESTGGALPLVGRDGATLAALARIGEGTAVLVSDASFLQNAALDRADNAALALGIAGPQSRSVVFLESVHGYTSATGLAALPDEWKWALAFAGLAALVMIAARVRRLGPPDELGRDLPPPRAAYVDSLAGILGRTGAPHEALAGLRSEALRRARIGDPEREDFDRVAAQLDLPEGEKRVLASGVRTESDGVLAAKALAKMHRRFGGDP